MKLTYAQACKYIGQHGVLIKRDRDHRMYELTVDLPMFKICQKQRVVNFIAHAGSRLHIGRRYGGSYKCRVDRCFVHSIYSLLDADFVNEAYSNHNSNFVYSVGFVSPDYFYMGLSTCAQGIHGFVDIDTTLTYNFT